VFAVGLGFVRRQSERAALIRVIAAKWHGASLVCQPRRGRPGVTLHIFIS
jgi:hypothetical protein